MRRSFVAVFLSAWSAFAGAARAQSPAASAAPSARPVSPPAPAAAAPSSRAPAVLTDTDGPVELQPAWRVSREAVSRTPVELAAGDKVFVGKRGRAVLELRDGSQVELGPRAAFTVEEVAAGSVSLALDSGKLWAFVKKARGRLFQVRTPTAVASVRGTEFSVAVGRQATAIEVFGGAVAVRSLLGDEALVGAQQRVDVLEGRLGSPERFEGGIDQRRERQAGEEDRGRGRERERSERPRSRDFDKDKLKAAIQREVGFQLRREAVESAAAAEMRNALYQEGKTLIDVFGQRVRVEEYLTRPTPNSFKFVSLNFRQGRLDRGLFEVTANAALPADLASVNLWHSPTADKPALYAIRQRWVMSNGIDSLARMALDGDSRQFTFVDQPVFNPVTGTFAAPAPRTEHLTVFGNVYEFVNENPALAESVWSNPAVRPSDSLGMTAHAVPVKVAVREVASPATVRGEYWTYGFAKGAGATGKFFVEKSFAPEPFKAHFVDRREYLNFVDGNGNGILDFGEPTQLAAAPLNPFGIAVFHDKDSELDATGAVVPFNGGVGVGSQQVGGDTTVFSDINRNGLDDQPAFSVAVGGPFDPALFALGRDFPRDWLNAEQYVIDDQGRVFDFRSLLGAAPSGNGAGANSQVASVFQRLNFERVLTSSRFAGRKIDVVMTPGLFLKAGLLKTANDQQGVAGPGNN